MDADRHVRPDSQAPQAAGQAAGTASQLGIGEAIAGNDRHRIRRAGSLRRDPSMDGRLRTSTSVRFQSRPASAPLRPRQQGQLGQPPRRVLATPRTGCAAARPSLGRRPVEQVGGVLQAQAQPARRAGDGKGEVDLRGVRAEASSSPPGRASRSDSIFPLAVAEEHVEEGLRPRSRSGCSSSTSSRTADPDGRTRPGSSARTRSRKSTKRGSPRRSDRAGPGC